ncbi:MAG: hypothetical protein JJT93_06395 [Gammaproteobacteria bacterium]|nr:hypothetical protein [Gammaproteobacteria bacterium]
MSRILRTVMPLLAIALLAGCVARLAYHNAEGYVVREVARYVDLDPAQRALVRDTVRDGLAWKGTMRSDDYAGFLRELAGDLGGLDRNGWERYLLQGSVYLEELGGQLAPQFAALLQSLDAAQREAFFAELERRNTELADERAEIDDPAAERSAQLERQLRRWLGRLTAEQQALIAGRAGEFETTADLWLAQRRRWQQALRDALEADDAGSCGVVVSLLLEPQALWPEEYAGILERNRERSLDLLGALSGSLSEAQWQRAERRLERYARTLEGIGELAAREWRRGCEAEDCPPPAPQACPAGSVAAAG